MRVKGVSHWARYLAVVAIVATHGRAGAQTTTWTDGSGFWFLGSNWSNGVPGVGITASINNNGIATLTGGAAQADNLTLGASADGSGTLNVTNFGSIAGSVAIAPSGLGLLDVGGQGHGTLTISGIATVADHFALIGDALDFDGQVGLGGKVSVTGASASWTTNDVFVFANGSMTITAGGTVTNGAANTGGGITTTIVSGAGSTWRNTSTLDLGSFGGVDEITVDSGGLVSVAGQTNIGAGDTVNIGDGGAAGTLQAGSVTNNGTLHFNHTGAVTFSAPLSGSGNVVKESTGDTTITNAAGFVGSFSSEAGRLILTNTLGAATFNADGNGVLRFEGATVNLGSAAIHSNGAGGAEYNNTTINGGFLRGAGIHTLVAGGTNTLNGVTSFGSNIVQNGSANFNNFTNGGTLTSNAALNFNGGVNNSNGTFTVNNEVMAQDFSNDGVWTINVGGQVDNGTNNLVCGGGSRTTLNPGGVVILSAGTTWELNGALLINNGEISGTTNVNFGSVAKGGGTYGTLHVLEGGTFTHGGSPGPVTITGNYVQADGATLLAEISNTGPGVHFDRVGIGGTAQLDGVLDVSLVDNFVPALGLSVELLHADGGITGTFRHMTLPALPAGLAWSVNYSAVAVLLGVTGTGLAGDYNGDGKVDAADYTAWRHALGETGAGLAADGDRSGVVDGGDYAVWRSNFGNIAASGAGATANFTVPEPKSIAMLLLAVVVAAGTRITPTFLSWT